MSTIKFAFHVIHPQLLRTWDWVRNYSEVTKSCFENAPTAPGRLHHRYGSGANFLALIFTIVVNRISYTLPLLHPTLPLITPYPSPYYTLPFPLLHPTLLLITPTLPLITPTLLLITPTLLLITPYPSPYYTYPSPYYTYPSPNYTYPSLITPTLPLLHLPFPYYTYPSPYYTLYTLSLHPIFTPYLYTLSLHPILTPYPYTLPFPLFILNTCSLAPGVQGNFTICKEMIQTNHVHQFSTRTCSKVC